MPEDDDLNFPLIALALVERHGDALTTDDVAAAWLRLLPGGRVFTAERIAYRNLLDGDEPGRRRRIGNPFQDWIGAQIRTDVYGWVCPGDPARGRPPGVAGRPAEPPPQRAVRGDVRRAAASAAAVAGRVDECLAAGLSVIPPGSRYAAAVRRGVGARARRGRHRGGDRRAVRRASATCTGCMCSTTPRSWRSRSTRSGGDFTAAITTVVAGGWDTDSNGATVGSICGALAGAAALPAAWIDPARATGWPRASRASTASASTSSPAARSRHDCGEGASTRWCRGPIDRRRRCRSTASSTPSRRSGEDLRRPRRPGRLAARGGPAAPLAGRGRGASASTRRVPATPRRGRVAASPWRSCGCGTSGSSTTAGSSSRPTASSTDARPTSAASTPSCCGTPTRSSALDERNQFDFYRDVPGLAELVAAFQRTGRARVRRLQPVGHRHPATRRSDDTDGSPRSSPTLGADGVFLDTMQRGRRRARRRAAQLDPPAGARGRVAGAARTASAITS